MYGSPSLQLRKLRLLSHYDEMRKIIQESALGIEVLLNEEQNEEEIDKLYVLKINDEAESVEDEIVADCVQNLEAAPSHDVISEVATKKKSKHLDPLSKLPPSYNRNFLDFPFFTDQKTIKHILKGKSKILFIMRGLPGSGKSSIVEMLKSTYSNSVVCSADNFFLNENGEYNFDIEKLGSAHNYCQKKSKLACENGTSIVIIDNTNVKRWEMKFYLETAKLLGYAVILVEPKTDWKFSPEILVTRNKHGVPLDVLQKKANAFDHVIPFFYGWFFSHKKSDLLRSLFSKVFGECLDSFPAFQRDLLSELGVRNSGRVSPDTSKEILLGYYTDREKTNPLLHCTSCFCGGGKASGGKKYDSRLDVQSSCGQVFRLILTGLVMTKKTCGLRVTLGEKCLSLFERPEEAEWVSRRSGDRNSKREATGVSISPSSSPRLPSNNGDWKDVKKKGDKKAAMSSKRLKKQLAKERKKQELENWFNSKDDDHGDDNGDKNQSEDFGKSKSRSSLSELMSARIVEKKQDAKIVEGLDNDDDDDNDDEDYNEDKKGNGSFLSNDEIQEMLDSKPNRSVAELFPYVRNTGFARSAHVTLKTANNVPSVETNLDVLHVCDLENSIDDTFNPSKLVSVTKGKAFYFGDGICCVYFDEPIKLDAVFSGYY